MAFAARQESHSPAAFSARLSASQKAYRSDPEGFLQRLSERAETLFESGYLVYPTEDPHVFAVAHHGGKEEKEYIVHALTGVCSCPFYTRQINEGERLTEETEGDIVLCKHARGLPELIRKTRRWLHETRRAQAYCALWTHWMRSLCAIRKRRMQAEKERVKTTW